MRIVLIIFLFAVIVLPVSPQSLSSVGVVSGMTAATQSWTYTNGTSPETGYRIGPAAGIFVEGFRMRGLSFLAELWYVQKGMSLKNGSATAEPSLIYLSVPLLLKYRFGDVSFGYYLTAGPRFDYLFHIDAQQVTAVTDALSEGESDLGASVGAGIQFPLGPIPDLHAEVRYGMSIIPVYKSDALTIRNSGIDILIGIGF